MHWIHLVLASSNVWGLGAFFIAWRTTRIGAIVVLLVMVASTLMHLSETKHGLNPGSFWMPWSHVLLNVDRVCAVLAFLYFLHMGWQCRNTYGLKEQIMLFAIAGAFNVMGEQTTWLPLYVISHLLWHGLVYLEMWILLVAYSKL